MSDELISVIIPVYNTGKYLDRCVMSVINQTYTNLEIILINDGSEDNSWQICKKYASSDNRVVAYSKENGGQSTARNMGIEKSNGKYIAFVDSDDYLEDDMFLVLYNNLKETGSDISCCAYIEERGNKKITYLDRNEFCTDGKCGLIKMLYLDDINASPCFKLFKKELWDNLRFPEGHIFEDMAAIYKVILSANYISHVNYIGYHYMIHSGSTTNKKKFDPKYLDSIVYSKEILNRAREIGSDEMIDAALAYYLSQMYDVILKIREQNGRKEYADIYRSTKSEFSGLLFKVLKNKHIEKKRKISYLLEFTNINWILKIIRQNRT